MTYVFYVPSYAAERVVPEGSEEWPGNFDAFLTEARHFAADRIRSGTDEGRQDQ